MIRPISRDAQDIQPVTKAKKILSENKTKTNNSVLVSNLNKVNNNRTAENRDPQKETLVIEKDPVLVPVESWGSNTQVGRAKIGEDFN